MSTSHPSQQSTTADRQSLFHQGMADRINGLINASTEAKLAERDLNADSCRHFCRALRLAGLGSIAFTKNRADARRDTGRDEDTSKLPLMERVAVATARILTARELGLDEDTGATQLILQGEQQQRNDYVAGSFEVLKTMLRREKESDTV